MYVCGGGEEKRKVGGTWVVGKKKKEIKKKKEMRSGVYVYGREKRGSGKERRKKKLKGKKLNWFYLFVYIVWCKT